MTYSWKNILISQERSVRDALQIIDSEALRVGLVVDCEQKLLGIITDGDVRRGILNGIALDAPVTKVMNSTPKVALVTSSKEELLHFMEKHDILSIPLVDGNGHVLGLQTLRESLLSPVHDNPVFIMAGGFGTRLHPLTDKCPKPMLQVGDKPMLEILILNFIKAGYYNFYISTHYLPEVIEEYFGDGSKWNVNITYVHECSPLGTGGALGLLPKEIPQLPLIMINGDVLTDMNMGRLLESHVSEGSDATMCVREYEYQVPYGVVQAEGNRIVGMVEKPKHYYYVNAGIYVLNPKIFNSIGKNTIVDMPTLLEQCISQELRVSMFPLHEYWLDIGRMDDFKRAQSDVKELNL